jgi:serine/threonine-protein kinase
MLSISEDEVPTQDLLDAGYQITGFLGSGGYANVYQAVSLAQQRPVAIKVIHRHLVQKTDIIERFRREAEAASSVKHPHVASVLGCGLLKTGQPYLIVEYLQGASLSSLLEQRGRMPWRIAVPMFMQICDGLHAARERNIVHRDIKPGNIFFISDRPVQVKILDFGLSRSSEHGNTITGPGETVGTLQYMSPEQCLGSVCDRRTDLYSLGYVMWETLTGKGVIDTKNVFQAMQFHMHGELPPPSEVVGDNNDIPVQLDNIIFKTLTKEPDDRYQTAQELRAALAAIGS